MGKIDKQFSVIGVFLLGRFLLIISLSYEGLQGYGDLLHYYKLASLGNPMIDYWIEYPPIFAYISRWIYLLVGGRENTFIYLLVVIFSFAQACGLYIFLQLYTVIYQKEIEQNELMLFLILLLCTPYGWWQFDSLVVFAMLIGLYTLLKNKDIQASLWIAVGILLKLFPVLLIPLALKIRKFRKILGIAGICLSIVVIVYGYFYLVSPEMTLASMISQLNKGSWETVWALIDGNLITGSFGPYSQRYIASQSSILMGNPAKIPPLLSLLIFSLVGLVIFYKYKLENHHADVGLFLITWCIFLLWSPGWSPQWVLYLIPLIFLAIPGNLNILISSALTLVCLLEWPILISRGYTWGLWLTIPVRSLIFIVIILIILMQNLRLTTSLKEELKIA